MKPLEPWRQRWSTLRHKLWCRLPVRYLTYLALGAWALLADPFTLSSTSDRALSREYHNFYVRLSGVEMAPLTVVTIDASSIRNLNADGSGWMSSNDWPLDYTDHARLISDLTVKQERPPASLFYDIYFEEQRDASGELERLGRRLSLIDNRGTGTDIVLAGGGTPMPMSPDAYERLDQPRLSATAWSGHGELYPLSAPIQFQDSETTETTPTPAAVMYQALCAAGAKECEWLDPSSAPAVSVHWTAVESSECIPAEPSSHIWMLAKRFLEGVLQGLYSKAEPSHLPAKCMPVHIVRASQLYGDDPVSLVPPGIDEDAPYAVMVGVVMPSTHDYIQTPVYERVPGVLLHAMAFENLWRLDDGYFHYRNMTYWGLLFWAAAVLLFMGQAERRHNSPPRRKLPWVLLWWAAIAGAVVLVQLVFHNILRIVPEGWLSLIAVVPLLREIVLRNEAAIMKIKENLNESR